jgi:alkaline phosphatase D
VNPLSRRQLLAGAGALVSAPALLTQERDRPAVTDGVQSGDVTDGGAIVWSRADRPARMIVEWDTSDRFTNPRRIVGPAALEDSDFTARLDLSGLPAGETIAYRVLFQDLADIRRFSEPAFGHLRMPPRAGRNLRVLWGGDTVGQGWGIDEARGGMLTYDAMRRREPDLFIHSGDLIYADNPLQREVRLPDGGVWRNLVTEAKSKVAETLDEFRGNYRYNLLDSRVRAFNADVPQLVQWDDHETRNNWYTGQVIEDPRYRVRSADLLAARGKRAMLEYTPLRRDPQDPERIYRAYRYGPLLEVFLLDERSYRGPNTGNRQTVPGPETAFLGRPQMEWLKARLKASRAAWKLIASDMPLGLVVGDAGGRYEAWANGGGPPLGRELELAELLRFIKANRIRNTVWITADVHYAAAHHYSPARAKFTDFLPFWEFVAGPLHAGNFGPSALDDTFGPEVRFSSAKPGDPGNLPPTSGKQFFGEIEIDGRSRAMTVRLINGFGTKVYETVVREA